MHLKEGLAAVKENVGSGKVIRPAPTMLNGTRNRWSPLVASPFFVVEMFELKEGQNFRLEMVRQREVRVRFRYWWRWKAAGRSKRQAQNRSPWQRAMLWSCPPSIEDFHVRPQWTVEFLKASLPSSLVPEPETRI